MPIRFEKMRKAIKEQLRKAHPDWSEEKIEKSSWAIAKSQWEKNVTR